MASSSISQKLTTRTSPFGLKLYIVIAICVGCLVAVGLFLLLCFRSFRSSRNCRKRVKHTSGLIPIISKDIAVIKASDRTGNQKIGDIINKEKEDQEFVLADAGKSTETRNRSTETEMSGGSQGSSSALSVENPNIGWGQWYALRELEIATHGFSDENVIGEGGYGIVYRGVLPDNSVVAVKNLLNNKLQGTLSPVGMAVWLGFVSDGIPEQALDLDDMLSMIQQQAKWGQAEKEFKVEVEAIGKVRHKNLVGLIGYCVEGAQRMLVYEYVDNGNLEQWLHGDVGPVSPLTWDVRMKIAVGTAKGLAYLHEGLEPKVVHRDVKSSNILLDKQWNPKVSDFGLAKLLGSDSSYVTTRVMGTFGYVAPEYASTGMLCEGSDVYSFGVLLMEIITGRSPVDYGRPAGEVNLIDWFKGMVTNRRAEELVDPLIDVQPSSRALKRVLLICLRCIDLDANKRPKMGQVVHMLEADEFPFRAAEHRATRDACPLPPHAGTAAIGSSNSLQAYKGRR